MALKIISIHLYFRGPVVHITLLPASQMVDANVTVIDSKSISFGLGYQIQHLVELVKEGVSTSEIVKKLNHLRENIRTLLQL